MEKQFNGDAPKELLNVCNELQKNCESLNSIFLQMQKEYDELNAAIDIAISKMKETNAKLRDLRNGTY